MAGSTTATPGEDGAASRAPAPGSMPLLPGQLGSSRLARWIFELARRHPFIGFVLVVILSNVTGSYFNVTYNQELIVSRLTPEQVEAFWALFRSYNAVAYTG